MIRCCGKDLPNQLTSVDSLATESEHEREGSYATRTTSSEVLQGRRDEGGTGTETCVILTTTTATSSKDGATLN